MQRIQTRESAPGIIDTLAAGFGVVNRAPWLLALPIAIDLFLWFGPHISVLPIAERLFARSEEILATSGSVNQAALEQFRALASESRQQVADFNVLSLVAIRVARVSSVAADVGGTLGATLSVASVAAAALIAVVALAIGILLGCLFLGAIARRVGDGAIDPASLVRDAGRHWLRVIGFIGLVIGLSIAVSVPLSILVVLAQAFAPVVGAILLTMLVIVAQLLGIWMVVYLFFMFDAIVLRDLGPVKAATASARVVATYFWSSLGFIALTLLILAGMDVIWRQVAGQLLGLGAAIVGNAYVAGGLAAASMLFFRDRVDRVPDPRTLAGQRQNR